MIKVENIETWGFGHAIRGMRNPMNSWDKSDSDWEFVEDPAIINPNDEVKFVAGPNDLDLMRRLYKAGPEHRKYLRQIFVSMDITAPLYWWKEFDTYKIGTVANSCSTMHKIHAKPFEISDFSHEHLEEEPYRGGYVPNIQILKTVICALNDCRKRYLETKDKVWWWQMIQLLPSSYNQRRTVTMSYENIMTMINQRSHHKLDEWRFFVDILRNVPYITEIRGENNDS